MSIFEERVGRAPHGRARAGQATGGARAGQGRAGQGRTRQGQDKGRALHADYDDTPESLNLQASGFTRLLLSPPPIPSPLPFLLSSPLLTWPGHVAGRRAARGTALPRPQSPAGGIARGQHLAAPPPAATDRQTDRYSLSKNNKKTTRKHGRRPRRREHTGRWSRDWLAARSLRAAAACGGAG